MQIFIRFYAKWYNVLVTQLLIIYEAFQSAKEVDHFSEKKETKNISNAYDDTGVRKV